MTKIPTADDLAKVILDMRYGDLMDIANSLFDMRENGKDVNEDGTSEEFWPLTDAHNWAQMLYSWAEANG